MQAFLSYTSIACTLSSSLVAQRPLSAQQKDAPAQTALACFEEAMRSPGAGCSQMQGVIVLDITEHWWKYRPVVVDAILDGLERLAITSDNLSVRV